MDSGYSHRINGFGDRSNNGNIGTEGVRWSPTADGSGGSKVVRGITDNC